MTESIVGMIAFIIGADFGFKASPKKVYIISSIGQLFISILISIEFFTNIKEYNVKLIDRIFLIVPILITINIVLYFLYTHISFKYIKIITACLYYLSSIIILIWYIFNITIIYFDIISFLIIALPPLLHILFFILGRDSIFINFEIEDKVEEV